MFNVNLAALKVIYETGDQDFIRFAGVVLEQTFEQQKELRQKGWYGNGV